MVTKDEQIVEGDQVSIYWENVHSVFDVEVLHAASGPGELWIVKERDIFREVSPGEKEMVKRGAVHYVMSFSRMTKVFVNERPNPHKGVILGPRKDSIFPSGGG